MTSVTPNSEIYTIARCLKELIVNRHIDDALNSIVEWLAESLNIDRCYISEASANGSSNLLKSIYAGSSNGNLPSLKSIQNIVFNPHDFPEIQSLLVKNQSFKVSINDDISPAVFEFLELTGLKSLLLIPLHSRNVYWGFIGFGDTIAPRTWRRSEVELQSLAAAIGVAVEASREKPPAADSFNSDYAQVDVKQFIWQVDMVSRKLTTSGNLTLSLHEAGLESIDTFIACLEKAIHPEDLKRAKEKLIAFITKSNATNEEEVMRFYNAETGNYAWLHCKLKKERNPQGECTNLCGTFLNVSETANIAFGLKKQKEHYNFLLKSVEQVIFTLDNRGNLSYLTPTWKNMLGYDLKDCLGTNLIQFMPRQEIRPFWENFGNLLLNNKDTFDQQMQMSHSNGKTIWVRIVAKSVKNEFNQVTGIFGSIENINNKYTADLLLKETNDKLTTILNNSKEIILTIDLENNLIESVNEAISILGYEPEEWIGQQYHLWEDDQRKKFHELMKLAVKSQLQVANQVISFNNKSNTEVITFEFSTNLFYFKNSKYLLCVLRDISDRVKYEQNLSRISQQLSHLINNIDDVYAIYDLAGGQFEFVSNNVEAMYGCSKETFSNQGLIWNDIIHLEDLPGIQKSFDGILQTNTKGEFFYRISTPDGEVKMIFEKITVGKNSAGQAEKLYIVKTDYTHIENIERSFIESERKFRFISENITDFISIHDTDWNFTYASPSVKNILGYEPEEIAGMAGFDLLHPDDLERTLDHLLRPLVLEHKETQLRYRLKAKDGKYKWVETCSKAVIDAKGQTTSIISSSRDVTDQVNAETMLKTSEEQYRLLSENSNDVIATYNLCGQFTYVSPSSLQVLGYTPFELIGLNPADVLAKSQADKEAVRSSMELIEEVKEPKKFIYTAVTKKGEEKWLEVVVQPVFKNNGVVAIQAASRDVTEREKLLIELEQSLAKERELNELRSMFVATASHQFRTPLTVIQSGVEIMELYLEDLPDAKQVRFQKQFNKIQTEVERLEFLMSDILLLGRANAARTPFHPQNGNVVSFIESILENKYNNRYPNERKVLLKVSGEATNIDFDEKLIGHAVENIISNAYKYSEKGNLKVHLTFAKNQFKIAISDKGIGIPPEEQKNLFQPFYRATNTNEIEGTGLGLAIVKEFVEKHNGKIFLSSKLNKGTTVSVILPVKQKF